MSPVTTKRTVTRRAKAASTMPLTGRACAWCHRRIWSTVAEAGRYCSAACEAREQRHAEYLRGEAARDARRFVAAVVATCRALDAERRKKPVARTGDQAMWGAYEHW